MLRNVQALRALAVIAVVLGHLQPLAQQVHPALGWVSLGRAGVDLFFVISGFIMVYTTEREAPSAGQFALRRLIRIAPLYWLVTLAVFALALIAPHLLSASRPDPVWLAKSLAFIPFDKGDGTTNPLVPVGWTLNYEMFFYACFALALLARGGAARYAALACALGALGLAGFFRSFDDVAANFYTRPIIVEFSLGVVLGLAFERLPRLSSGAPALVASAALAGLVTAVALSGLASTEALRVAVAGTASLGVVAIALMLEKGERVVRNRLVLLIGDASYAIYLTHIFITQVAIKAAQVAGVRTPLGAAVVIVASLAGVVIAGWLTYRIYERPMGRALKALTRRMGPASRPAERGAQA